MGMFEAFREGDGNTYYGAKRTAVTIDITQVIILYFSLVIAIALLILVIGSRSRERWTTLLRLVFSLHTSVVILVCLFGYGWQTGEIQTACQYTVTYKGFINAKLGLHLGLKDFNITLKGTVNHTNDIGDLNYNERFSIDKVSSIAESYMKEMQRGLPWPILQIAEYLYEDQGGLRWMRFYHEAGHFAYIVLWCALIFWAMGNILIGFVVSRGALLITVSGLSMLCACVVYASIHPPHKLIIAVNGTFLTLHYGWSFWLCIVSGVITTCSGIAVLVALFINPDATSLLFLVDTSSIVDDKLQINPLLLQNDGPLQFKSPYTERRQSMAVLPHVYSNPAFSPVPGSNSLKKRSFSFDFGGMTRPSESQAAIAMTSLASNQSQSRVENEFNRTEGDRTGNGHSVLDKQTSNANTSQLFKHKKERSAFKPQPSLDQVPEVEDTHSDIEAPQRRTNFSIGETITANNAIISLHE